MPAPPPQRRHNVARSGQLQAPFTLLGSLGPWLSVSMPGVRMLFWSIKETTGRLYRLTIWLLKWRLEELTALNVRTIDYQSQSHQIQFQSIWPWPSPACPSSHLVPTWSKPAPSCKLPDVAHWSCERTSFVGHDGCWLTIRKIGFARTSFHYNDARVEDDEWVVVTVMTVVWVIRW